MIAYIKGKLTYKSPTEVYLETSNGVAYHVHISVHTYALLESLEEVQLLTHLIVKEDSHTLYGFISKEEKLLFIKLLSVSGIGPNTSRVILSSMTPDEVVRSIAHEDHVRFSKVKGIGPKTAKRIILDLKDKINLELAASDTKMVAPDRGARNEALSALITLGFPKNAVEKALTQIYKDNPDPGNSEQLIKAVLKKLS